MQQQTLSRYDYIKGALWGAVLGDVIGAHLQFDKDVTQKKIKQSFDIVGGGKHHLEPGQPTDDSQLNFSILRGLLRGKGLMNLNFIAEQMGNWYLSKPIDVGNTIRNSVPKACNMKVHQAHLCRKGAKECSQTSQSNGTLMALIGLALWCHKLPIEAVFLAVRQFTKLIHPNELVALSNIFYVLLVHYLLNHTHQTEKAIKAFNFAKKQILQYSTNGYFAKWLQTILISFNNPKLLEEQVPIVKSSGWVRVALSYAVLHLVISKSIKESIRWIISQKGDTDTNACIMGGLLGAYYGFQHMNMNDEVQKIAKWTSKNRRRPDWLIPGKVIPKFIDFLDKHSPNQLKMIGSEAQYQNPSKK